MDTRITASLLARRLADAARAWMTDGHRDTTFADDLARVGAADSPPRAHYSGGGTSTP